MSLAHLTESIYQHSGVALHDLTSIFSSKLKHSLEFKSKLEINSKIVFMCTHNGYSLLQQCYKVDTRVG